MPHKSRPVSVKSQYNSIMKRYKKDTNSLYTLYNNLKAHKIESIELTTFDTLFRGVVNELLELRKNVVDPDLLSKIDSIVANCSTNIEILVNVKKQYININK
jgi:hypothetical protein